MNKERIKKIIEKHQIKNEKEISFLGEGAWHNAYLADQQNKKLVIRIPKDVAYGEKVHFDEKELLTEYESQKVFYEHANKVCPGIAPEYFEYNVEPNLTYTIESFAGEKIDLHQVTQVEAFEIGSQYGQFFLKLNREEHDLDGFGYLSWNGEKGTVEGGFHSDVSKFMHEENKEILEEDYPYFVNSDFVFDKALLRKNLQSCIETRTISSKVSLTNQDTSPENILISNNKIRIIDPYPVLYYGHTFAGNFLNNYESLFVALSNSPRYEKHNFHEVPHILKAIAQGFLKQYCQNDKEVRGLVRREQYLQLFQSTIDHVKMSEGELPLSKQQRYGTKEQVKSRIPLFIKQLEEFEL